MEGSIQLQVCRVLQIILRILRVLRGRKFLVRVRRLQQQIERKIPLDPPFVNGG